MGADAPSDADAPSLAAAATAGTASAATPSAAAASGAAAGTAGPSSPATPAAPGGTGGNQGARRERATPSSPGGGGGGGGPRGTDPGAAPGGDDDGEAPGFGEAIGGVRAAFMRMVDAHLALLRAELAVVGREIAIIAGLGFAALTLALLTLVLVYVGTFLFLGEWLFGSMGWGILHGTLLAGALITAVVLNLAGGWMGAVRSRVRHRARDDHPPQPPLRLERPAVGCRRGR